MSETQFSRLEDALKSIDIAHKKFDTTTTWFRNAAITFAIATIAMIGSVALNNYRLNKVESDIPYLASKRGVELLETVHNAETNALISMLDSAKKFDIRKVYDETSIIKSQIFAYGMGITRGEKQADKNTVR